MTGTEQRFEVEAILDKKIINGKEKFKVKLYKRENFKKENINIKLQD